MVEDKNGLLVELSTDKPVFYVNLETPGIKGIFEDNSITVKHWILVDFGDVRT